MALTVRFADVRVEESVYELLGCDVISIAGAGVGVGVAVGCVHVGRRARQLAAVIVGVGDDIGVGVCAARAGHGGSPPDCVVRVAVGGDCAVLHLVNQISARLV